MSSGPTYGISLRRTAEREREIDAAAAAHGDRVGVDGLVDDLNRRGARTRVPGRAVAWGFRWNAADDRTQRWWPQGITSAPAPGGPAGPGSLAGPDAVPAVAPGGRRLLVTSWYAKTVGGQNAGSRLSVVDLDSLEYRHVLLVVPEPSPDGRVELRPLRVHAGGLSWVGPYLHVAATRRGLYTCRLDDLLRLRSTDQTFGYRYVLPVRFAYAATAVPEVERMRYSFLSLDRGAEPPALVVGEYGRDEMTRRLARFPLDPRSWHLAGGDDGSCVPDSLDEDGPGRMQGAVVVDGTWFVTTSRGRHLPGTLHVGHPGHFRRFPLVLPIGPEDIDHDPVTDLLWSVTEYPERRYVFSVPRTRFTAT